MDLLQKIMKIFLLTVYYFIQKIVLLRFVFYISHNMDATVICNAHIRNNSLTKN